MVFRARPAAGSLRCCPAVDQTVVMRLVFVHGMRQERKNADALRQEWEDALNAAWTKANLARPNYVLEMPFYGDVLNDLTEAVRGSTGVVVSRGAGGPGLFTP